MIRLQVMQRIRRWIANHNVGLVICGGLLLAILVGSKYLPLGCKADRRASAPAERIGSPNFPVSGAMRPDVLPPEQEKFIWKASKEQDVLKIVTASITLTQASHFENKPKAWSVYNTLFAPTVGDAKNALLDGRKTRVRFNIGTPEAKSAIPEDKAAVNPKVQQSSHDRRLTITLSCSFCAEPSLQKEQIDYSPAQDVSTWAEFEIIPSRSSTKDHSGKGEAIFQVTEKGVLYDNIVVPVSILPQDRVDDKSLNDTGAKQVALANISPPPNARDIDLTLTCFVEGNTVAVSLEPSDPPLAKRFRRRHMAGAHLRVFHTGLSAAGLWQLIGGYYLNLVSLVEQNTQLKKALTGNPNEKTNLSGSSILSTSDEQILVTTLFNAGADLYRKMFLQGPDQDLRALMRELDKYDRADRPIRIRIETQNIFVPWQLLHIPGRATADGFWGFRYELIVDPQGHKPPGYYPGLLEYKTGPTIFAKYRTNGTSTEADREVAELGNQQLDFLTSKIGIKGVVKVDSRQAFLDALMSQRESIQIVMAYTHAVSGTILQSTPTGEMVPLQDVAGPKLKFFPGEFVNADALDELMTPLQADQIQLFEQHPLVVLNGCETGTGGFFATAQKDFPSAFLRLGARGVIATEAPVWTYFGYFFGSHLVQNLKGGEPASLALLNTRREFLKGSNNPLGLLYSYYGGANVSVALH